MKRLLLAVGSVLVLAGCAFRPAELPVPGAGVDGPTYPLRVEFGNVLNLPQGAKVIADGVRIGELTGVTVVDAGTGSARPGFVIADIEILETVRLPLGTRAELRQETPLGDVHIALTEPAEPGAGRIEPGATIPLADTAQPPLIEDILAALSIFIGSGAVTDIQDLVRTMNGVLPADPRDTARLAETVGADLNDLAADAAALDDMLHGLEAVVQQGVLDNAPVITELLTPYGVQQTTDAMNAQIGVIFVLTSLGPVGPSTAWLGPLLAALEDTVRAVVPVLFGAAPFDTAAPSNLKKLTDLLQTKVIPFAERGPKVDLSRVTVGSSPMSPEEQTTRIVDTLRMIGAVR
ncbi:MlaD family protein [Nocardia sp. NPDC057353]|uniref:MlaD family protein n=1 Tax=Nocardia sp. NPDC057353 TaxID=3346104 RepID=UPI00363E6A2A